MTKIDFLYCKLCEKYGFESIAIKKEIKSFYNMKPNENGEFEVDSDLKQFLGGVYFINLNTKEKIDLQKEMNEGTFNG